jgi:hypothetical protein
MINTLTVAHSANASEAFTRVNRASLLPRQRLLVHYCLPILAHLPAE